MKAIYDSLFPTTTSHRVRLYIPPQLGSDAAFRQFKLQFRFSVAGAWLQVLEQNEAAVG